MGLIFRQVFSSKCEERLCCLETIVGFIFYSKKPVTVSRQHMNIWGGEKATLDKTTICF